MDALNEYMQPTFVWFVVGLVLLIAEFIVPGLVIFFFGIAAWVVALLCFFIDLSLNTQLVIFLISSIVLVITLRKYVKSVFIGKVQDDMDTKDMDGFIGEQAIVEESIVPPRKGRITFRGTGWDAEAEGEIAQGATVEIIGKTNLTLQVKSI